MAKDSPRQWDTTPASNTDIGGITLAENVMRPPAVNNAMREHMGQVAEYIDEMSYPTAGGSANALTLTPATPSAAYAAGDVWTFTAASSNTTAATLNISGLGAKAIRKISGGTDVALVSGDIAEAGRYTVTYDSAANSTAGAWILVGNNAAIASTTDQLTGTDAAKMSTPDSVAALWVKGSDVTAASTITLGEGGLFKVIGNTTITDIDFAVPADGRRATLIFEGAPLLTHNGTTLNLPGGADRQVVAGDRCDVVQDDADNIYITNYTPGSYPPISHGTTTPTPTAQSGTFTSVSASLSYTRIGDRVIFDAVISITTAGTAAGNIVLPLPFTPGRSFAAAAVEPSSTVFALFASGNGGTPGLFIRKYDGTTIIASGRNIQIGGSFRV